MGGVERRLLARLADVERERSAIIGELVELGHIRGRGLVGEVGERFAAAYYGVELAPPATPGYDLVDRDGRRVQVRTLRCTPTNFRTTLGTPKEPYDVLFAIRIDEALVPLEAIEVPKLVVDEFYVGGRASWTKKVAADKRVKWIGGEALVAATG